MSGGDRKGERKRTAIDVSKQEDDIKTGAVKWRRDEPGGCPLIGQAVSGMEAARVRSAASAWNVGRRTPIRLNWRGWGSERERTGRRKPSGAEYRCGIRWRTGS
ncbi:hypothetical protein Vqi01_14760 [Micromonospora qiuiae]|uniref:Uncharacterized protein n=1 Tax=Micromonospora qiuiae TaxID=502268 RepID=A0ABQ4J819_9ACTN|nr:hypothetical protein Vqi01_14760 [Micromonospora qiuiae]